MHEEVLKDFEAEIIDIDSVKGSNEREWDRAHFCSGQNIQYK